jgi:acetyltransferase-like isoleucine patch superfamily enzyme
MNIKYYFAKAIKFLHIPATIASKIHRTSKIASASHVVNTKIGKYSYIGNNCTIIEAEIGNFCSLADNVIIGGASHPIKWVSTSPVFHHGKNILKENFSTHIFQTTKKTIIKNDVWIGNNSLIKSGIIIQNGAVVGMGSVVTKDIGAYEIWAGNPARLIKKRFSETIIDDLVKISWWEWDDYQLKKYSKYMNNPIILVKHCKIHN